jgi:hypothetical protein
VAGEATGAFGPVAPVDDLADALVRCGLPPRRHGDGLVLDTADPAARTRVTLVAAVHGWHAEAGEAQLVLTPGAD